MRIHALLVRCTGLAAISAAGLLVPASPARAQDFELHPAVIEGTVELGSDVVLQSGTIQAAAFDPATGLTHSASTSLVLPAGGGTSGTYRLTVEAGTSGLTYSVFGVLRSSTDFLPEIRIPARTVAVTEGQTALRDLRFPEWHFGTVNVSVSVTGIASLVEARLFFQSTDSVTGIRADTTGTVPSSGSAALPAGPGVVVAGAQATVMAGGVSAVFNLETRTFSLPASGSHDLAYSLHVGSQDPGSLSGRAEIRGAAFDAITVRASGGTPVQSLAAQVGSGGPFSFDPVNPGTWSLFSQASDAMPDGSTRFLRSPFRTLTVAPGQDVAGVDFVEDAVFARGTLRTGDWRNPLSSFVSVSASSGLGSLAHVAGQSWSLLRWPTAGVLPYELVLGSGHPWRFNSALVVNRYSAASSDGFSENSVGALVPSGDIGTPTAGDVTERDISVLDFRSSIVTLRLTVAGGGTLTNPTVSASGIRRSPAGELLYGTTGSGATFTPQPVAAGTVTLTLAPGTYTLQAFATVQGSRTSFGVLRDFVVLPGDDIEQDLEAPALALGSPAPLAEFECGEDVAVSGTATDPSGVASVSVNGVAVAVAADGSFSTVVAELPVGENAIAVTATDSQGNAVTIRRTVVVLECTDAEAPSATAAASVGSLWPPNHRMVPVTISGTAADASGVLDIQGWTISSSERDDSKGDGRSTGDCDGRDGFAAPAAFPATVAVGPDGTFSFTVNLRAERQGTGSDRVYTVAFEVRDPHGNATPVAVQVLVPHDR